MNQIEAALAALLNEDALVREPSARQRYLTDWLGTSHGHADAIVRPRDRVGVAACVAWCFANGVGVVPQGGHTGLTGGATPLGGGSQVVLSLERLDRILDVDPVSNTITVEAGAILQRVQDVAAAHGRLLPLSLGAEGSCQIGGCISTNAGGTAVLRYGNTRELVLGMEVVLHDGSLWTRLNALRKDNAGFDLKQLFIGSEGTLGIVTAATLRLFAQPRQTQVVLAAVPDIERVIDLFVRIRNAFDAELTAFEFMTGQGMAMSAAHLGRPPPLAVDSPYVVLFQISSPHEGAQIAEAMLQCLSEAADAQVVLDAVVASNEEQAQTFWRLRESLPESMLRQHGPQFAAHDVSVPIRAIPAFIREHEAWLEANQPSIQTLLFGHVGDGNVHVNHVPAATLEQPFFEGAAGDAALALFELTARHGGSFSAEHGIGAHKRDTLLRHAPPAQLALMRRVKAMMDPRSLMNPGKVLASV